MCKKCANDDVKVQKIVQQLAADSGAVLNDGEINAVKACMMANADYDDILFALKKHRTNSEDPTYPLPEHIEKALGRPLKPMDVVKAITLRKTNPEMTAQEVADAISAGTVSGKEVLPEKLHSLVDLLDSLSGITEIMGEMEEDGFSSAGVHKDEGKDSVTSQFPGVTKENMKGHEYEVEILREFSGRFAHFMNQISQLTVDKDLSAETRHVLRAVVNNANGFLIEPFPMMFSSEQIPASMTETEFMLKKIMEEAKKASKH